MILKILIKAYFILEENVVKKEEITETFQGFIQQTDSKSRKILIKQEIEMIYAEGIKKEIGYIDEDLINRMVEAEINPNWKSVKI